MNHYAESLVAGTHRDYPQRCWDCGRVFRKLESYVNVRKNYWGSPGALKLHKRCALRLGVEMLAEARAAAWDEDQP